MPGPLEKFVYQLLTATEDGSVQWERTPARSRYRLPGASGVVVIEQLSEIPTVIKLQVLDARGQDVGAIETDPYREGPWHDWEKALMSLYEQADLQARGTTDVLKGLKEEFGLKEPASPDDDIPF